MQPKAKAVFKTVCQYMYNHPLREHREKIMDSVSSVQKIFTESIPDGIASLEVLEEFLYKHDASMVEEARYSDIYKSTQKICEVFEEAKKSFKQFGILS